MILYFDENLPLHLMKGFDVLQRKEGLRTGNPVTLKFIPHEFGKAAKDQDWIREIGNSGGCVLTQDINIHRRKHEMELLREHNIGMFFLKGKSKKDGLSVWQMVETLAKNWLDMIEIIYADRRPFAYEIKPNRKIKNLN